jgi:hypothetical protein
MSTQQQLDAANRIIAEQNRTIAKMNQEQVPATNGNGHPPAMSAAEIMESLIIKGDLSRLTPGERATYYARVCESCGLNPLTKPFDYLQLGGKLVLYANRNCGDQLRMIHNISVVELTESERDGVFIVTAKMQNRAGRTDMAKGAVTITGMKGDTLANALMKCETKAKRRCTLSLCGLSLLDETEIETIPGATVVETDRPKIEYKNAASNTMKKVDADKLRKELLDEMFGRKTTLELREWYESRKEVISASFSEEYRDSMYREYLGLKAELAAGEKVKTGGLSAAMAEAKAAAPKAQFLSGEMPDPTQEFGAWMAWVDTKCSLIGNEKALETFWNTTVSPLVEKVDQVDQMEAIALYDRHQQRFAQ